MCGRNKLLYETLINASPSIEEYKFYSIHLLTNVFLNILFLKTEQSSNMFEVCE